MEDNELFCATKVIRHDVSEAMFQIQFSEIALTVLEKAIATDCDFELVIACCKHLPGSRTDTTRILLTLPEEPKPQAERRSPGE